MEEIRFEYNPRTKTIKAYGDFKKALEERKVQELIPSPRKIQGTEYSLIKTNKPKRNLIDRLE